MQIEIVSIESIHLDPSNVRLHLPRNLDVIAASLAKYDQQKPIVVGADNVILAGNGTYLAAKQLGWATIKIVRSALSGSAAVGYSIADNRSGDPEVGSIWDEQSLASTIASLQAKDGFDPASLGFTADEVAKLIGAESGLPSDAAGAEFDAGVAADVELLTCPHCGKQFPK